MVAWGAEAPQLDEDYMGPTSENIQDVYRDVIGGGGWDYSGEERETMPPVEDLPIVTAGLPALPAAGALITGGLGALGVTAPAWLTALLGGAGVAYGGAQALGLGEGGGLFDNNLLGGDEFTMGGVEFGGPGLAEPPAKYLLKEWHVKYDWGRLQYYLVKMPGQSRKIAMYNTKTKRWKVWTWRAPRLAVIGKNMPSHKMITRLRRNLSKHRADADTILKMTSPTYQAYKARRRKRR